MTRTPIIILTIAALTTSLPACRSSRTSVSTATDSISVNTSGSHATLFLRSDSLLTLTTISADSVVFLSPDTARPHSTRTAVAYGLRLRTASGATSHTSGIINTHTRSSASHISHSRSQSAARTRASTLPYSTIFILLALCVVAMLILRRR